MERDHRPELHLPGVHPSPNIQGDADIYEIENEAVDPERHIEAAMWRIGPWRDKVVLDLGSGTGYHLPRFHEQAAHVIGVEPHGPSHVRAAGRISSRGLERASVIRGSAEAIPLPDQSVDVVHCRFAYFAGPGSEPGLAELERVVRPGGTAFIIDNDLTGGQFAEWLRMSPYAEELDQEDSAASYYRDHDFEIESIESEWRFRSRTDLESVVRLEFPADVAERIIRDHRGTRVSYHYLLIHRTY
jgi:SAM-dependent methyltransferase